MSSKGFYEPLIKSYEQILNLITRKCKSYFHLGKRPAIDGESEIMDRKGVSAPQKRSEFFHCYGCFTYFMYIDHLYMYLCRVIFCQQFFYFLLFDFLFFLFRCLILTEEKVYSILYINWRIGKALLRLNFPIFFFEMIYGIEELLKQKLWV